MSANITNPPNPEDIKSIKNTIKSTINTTNTDGNISDILVSSNKVNSTCDNVKQSSKQRCPVCDKVIKLMEMEYCKCKCNLIFCSKHRLPISNHNINTTLQENGHICVHDYVTESKNNLIKTNPKIVLDKMGNRL